MDEARFRALWFDATLTNRDVAEMAGCTMNMVYRLGKRYGLPMRTFAPRFLGRNERHRDPTPAEIQDACLKTQAGWSDEERERRSIGKPDRWLCPVISLRS